MVPATDERTSANEPEDNTPTRGAFFERLKFWRHCKQEDEEEDEEPARLTPMPACLMHWWTPLLVAAIFFGPSLIFAIIWGGQPHWPSSKAMKLCMTIAGAGLAFSAWQQRSHDNATNAKQTQAAIEREDYWKRREHIFQLLGSKNPGLRLGAVALLAELADSAAQSTLLNETEKQQLQRHIIDTLCLQVRHEGLNQADEGTGEEHAKIQQSIVEIILKRINTISQQQRHANWSDEEITLDQCHIIGTIQIEKVVSNARLSLNQTVFHESLTIKRSQLLNLEWEDAIIERELFTVNSSTIKLTTPPLSIRRAVFSNSIIHPSIGN